MGVFGVGAVSPAGWGVASLLDAVEAGQPLPAEPVSRPGWKRPLQLRRVPAMASRPAFFAHPRMRRSSGLSQHAMAAALEALGDDRAGVETKSVRIGIVYCLMAGCVEYTRRFYDEVLRQPDTASPLLFPETVFNAPASHLATFLGSSELNYSLIGDDTAFLQGLLIASQWLRQRRVDGCLVVGAEESDWIVAEALHLFEKQEVHGSGAGALYLKLLPETPAVPELVALTDHHLFFSRPGRAVAAQNMARELISLGAADLLVGGEVRRDSPGPEAAAWMDSTCPRRSLRPILGQAFTASAAWHCAVAVQSLNADRAGVVDVSVVGVNQAAMGARFANHGPGSEP